MIACSPRDLQNGLGRNNNAEDAARTDNHLLANMRRERKKRSQLASGADPARPKGEMDY